MASIASFLLPFRSRPEVVVEVGSHSVKLHGSRGETHKVPHDAAAEVVRSKVISEGTMGRILEVIRDAPGRVRRVVLTGVFSRARNSRELVRALEKQFGAPCRALSSAEEVEALVRAHRRITGPAAAQKPVALGDLGGWTFEVAHLTPGQLVFGVSFSLGADLVHWRSCAAGLQAQRVADEAIARELDTHALPHVQATFVVGGTMRSLASLQGNDRITTADLALLAGRLALGDPLDEISPERARVLPAGCRILQSYLRRTGEGDLIYSRALEVARAQILEEIVGGS